MPVMPDTRILSGGISEPQPMPSPMQTLGSMMKIKEEQQAYRARQLEAEEKQREYEDDMAVRFSLQQHERPEDAMENLLKQGRAGAYSKLGKDIYTARTAENQAKNAQLKYNADQLGIAGQMLASVGDDASYQPVRRTVVDMAKGILGEGAEDLFPTTYDKDKVGLIVKMATDRQNQIQQEHNANVLINQGHQLALNEVEAGIRTTPSYAAVTGRPMDKNAPQLSPNGQKIMDAYQEGFARRLMTAQTQQQMDAIFASSDDIPPAIVAKFKGIPFGRTPAEVENSRQRIEMLGLDLKEQAEVTQRRESAKTDALRQEDAILTAEQAHQDRLATLNRQLRRDADLRKKEEGGGKLTPKEIYDFVDKADAEDTKTNEWVREAYNAHPGAFNQYDKKTGKYTRTEEVDTTTYKKRPAFDFSLERLAQLPEDDEVRQGFVDRTIATHNKRRERVEHKPKIEDAARVAKKANDVAAYDQLAQEYAEATSNVGDLSTKVPWKNKPKAGAVAGAGSAQPMTPQQRDEASNRSRAIYQRLGSDKTLSPTQRADLVQQAAGLLRQAKGQ